MSNYLGVQILAAYKGKPAAPLSSLCRRLLGLSSSGGRRRLQDSSPIFNFEDVVWEDDSIVSQQTVILEKEEKILENEEMMMKELGDIEKKEDTIQATLDVMVDAITAVQVKLDMEPTIDPKVNNDKSKKPKARKPKAVKDDGGEEIPDEKSLFNRNLLETGNDGMKRTIEAMEGKLDSVEEEIKTTSIAVQDEVELIKGEVKGMKVKVESMESKVDKIEQSMKNIEDMLSKLLTTGGVAAG